MAGRDFMHGLMTEALPVAVFITIIVVALMVTLDLTPVEVQLFDGIICGIIGGPDG